MSEIEQKLDIQQLTPDELIQYQNFFNAHSKMLTEVGKITMEYQAMLDQAKQGVSQIVQVKDSWTLKTLSSRGINPIAGNYEIDPMTGNIINKAKLHVAS
jgi:hypothetical protein